MPAERAEKTELLTKGYVIRRDQVESIEELTAERPGASLSDIARDVIDFGLTAYRNRQQRIREMDAERERVSA